MRLSGSTMIRILEELLPARFGGSPLDYQLLEEEDDAGYTRLTLLVSPRIEIDDEKAVTGAVLEAIDPPGPISPRVNLVLGLEADEDAQWKAVRAKVRNQVRKADRECLYLNTGSTEELLDGFYEPFSVNMRELGSPVHSRGFFREAGFLSDKLTHPLAGQRADGLC